PQPTRGRWPRRTVGASGLACSGSPGWSEYACHAPTGHVTCRAPYPTWGRRERTGWARRPPRRCGSGESAEPELGEDGRSEEQDQRCADEGAADVSKLGGVADRGTDVGIDLAELLAGGSG